jgi:DNA repair exonuclease SbcCD ATPase subunit
MSIEMAAIDALTEEGQMSPELAIAMAKSIDLSITSANLVTMTVFNERFAQSDIRFAELTTKLEARFSQLEGSIAAAKVWAIGLYGALVIAGFGALAADHHWLVGRQDQLLERIDRRFELMDQRFQQIDQHFQQIDQRFRQIDEHLRQIDQRFEQIDQHFQQIDRHLLQIDQRLLLMDQRLQQLEQRSPDSSALSKGRGASSTHGAPP